MKKILKYGTTTFYEVTKKEMLNGIDLKKEKIELPIVVVDRNYNKNKVGWYLWSN